MMQTLRIGALCWIVLGGAFTLAGARGQDPDRPRVQREEMEDLLEAYIISKLQDALQLDDDQFARMVVAQKRLQEDRRRYRRERRELLEQLRRGIRSAGTEDSELERLLTRLAVLQNDFEQQQRADYEAIDGILDVRQRARYRLLEQEIERRIQELIREIRGRRSPQDRSNANR